MALKILKESDPVEVKQLTFAVYAPPGVGKTSLAFTASKPLLFDFDHGAYRSAFRKDSVPVDAWGDVANVSAEDVADYDTIIVDTAGRALDALTTHLIASNPKAGNRDGGLTLQGYGSLKSQFTGWLKRLHTFGKDVILLAHSDEQRDGDNVIQRLDVQGGSKNEIYKAADAMGHLATQQKKRMLIFDPTEAAFGKNPAQVDPLEVPHFGEQPDFMAQVISDTKAALNKQTEAQKAVVAEMEDWASKCDKAESPEDFTKLAEESTQASEAAMANVKRLVAKRAKSAGYAYDEKAKAFKEVEPA